MKKILIIPALLFCSVVIFAQPQTQANPDWVKFEAFTRDYSFLIPEGYFAYRNKKTQEIYFSSYKDQVSINIHITLDLFSKDRLRGLEEKYDQTDCQYDYYTLRSISGKIFTCENREQFYKTIYLSSGSRLFRIVVGALSPYEKNVAKFLGSLRLYGTQVFPKYTNASTGNEKTVPELGLKNDPLVEQYMGKPDNSNIKVTVAPATGKKNLFNADSTIYSRDLIVLRKKAPKPPKSIFGTRSDSGSVRLRVKFLSSGRIEEVEVVSSTNAQFTYNVVESLKELRFIPAQIDGKDVDCTRVMEFLYGSL